MMKTTGLLNKENHEQEKAEELKRRIYDLNVSVRKRQKKNEQSIEIKVKNLEEKCENY